MSDSNGNDNVVSLNNQNEYDLRVFMNSPDFQDICEQMYEQMVNILNLLTPLQRVALVGVLDEYIVMDYGISLAEVLENTP